MGDNVEMYAIEIPGTGARRRSAARHVLVCSECGYVTFDDAVSFCPGCGRRVGSIVYESDEMDPFRWVHGAVFDEGYAAAMDEVENEG